MQISIKPTIWEMFGYFFSKHLRVNPIGITTFIAASYINHQWTIDWWVISTGGVKAHQWAKEGTKIQITCHMSGQVITTSAEVTLNIGLVRESPPPRYPFSLRFRNYTYTNLVLYVHRNHWKQTSTTYTILEQWNPFSSTNQMIMIQWLQANWRWHGFLVC